MNRPCVAIRSPGIWKLRRDVETLTGLEARRYRLNPPAEAECLVGWGHRPSAAPVRRHAKAKGLPYLRLEDGFLRSIRPGAGVDPALGFVLDRQGIYYDARQPSDLEALLQDGGWEGPELLRRARDGMALLRRLRLSKYNDGIERSAEELDLTDKRRRVLVIDQTAGDISIPGALAEASDFTAMLEAALAENPDAEVVVKGHPEVARGLKRGYLPDAGSQSGVRLLSESINPWSLLDRVDRVYTVSSGLGFEALCAGLPVTCFGIPFYAGWGATDDRKHCARRTRPRSTEEIFAAAYLLYSRYLDPWDRKPVPFEEAAEALAFLRDIYWENKRPAVLVGFTRWKRKTVAAFLRGDTAPRFEKQPATAVRMAQERDARLLVWNTRCPPDLRETAAHAGVPLINVEDGFLRSVGLGAALNPAASLVFDDQGIYYDPTQPSRLEQLAETTDFCPELRARAEALRQTIVERAVSKYNVGRRSAEPLFPPDRKAVFVPGQVEDDQSVQLGAPECGGNLGLLRRARGRNPDAFILYKPHPDVEAGYRQGALEDREVCEHADSIVRDVALPEVLAQCDAVETMTSLVGFEALLRDKQVTVHGRPFYAGWGLTEDLLVTPRRRRRLTLDELVAVALILYPRYLDPVSSLPCPPELVVTRLAEGRGGKPPRRIIWPIREAVWHLMASGRRLWNRRLQREG
ncbi:capsular polysaccharide biosynthesis protein [Aquibaculum sediminis]|uniref:capsular polysaccharide biosynthesis protein n=1 Tax=Aquibaculum sediminis TaxID=3231907 RepID=UPI0034520380